MKKAITATQKHFESSSNRTPEYLAWHRLFKREFTKFLQSRTATLIEIGKPNHFDMSGFFTIGNQAWYFRIEDVRWSKRHMLIRKAKDYKDYTGGTNHYASLEDESAFATGFARICLQNILTDAENEHRLELILAKNTLTEDEQKTLDFLQVKAGLMREVLTT